LVLAYDTEKKNKNIRLLKQQSKFRNEKIHNEIILRYGLIGGLAVLVLFVVLLYNRSRLKQKTNNALQRKQEKINEQNDDLKKLLNEKEWLLKEIHHRVKNNLQIVISLLNTQSAYLENKDALTAIQNSQHRMYSMSLIHQKLYQSDNLASIDMSWYIHELVNYLKECFGTADKKINYNLDTQPIEFNVTYAVPLGLILNEAISNAIKYAFTGKEKGNINIVLQKDADNSDDSYQLIIADNGTGLPQGFELIERESLGMDLMIGLTDQLDGTLELQNNNGLTIIITFRIKDDFI
jgi:two-component sensor histidine kinase